MRLYRAEQKKLSPALQAMSPEQRKKTLDDRFRALSVEEIEQWKLRARAAEAAKTAPPSALLSKAAKEDRPPSAVEITPYEFFIKEQRSNPAVVSAGSPREKEVVLLRIYNTLPDKAREALEQRAEDYNNLNRYGRVDPKGTKSTDKKKGKARKPKPKKVRRLSKRTLDRLAREAKREAQRAAKLMAKEAADMFKEEDRATKKEKKKKRKASPFALFVKEQIPLFAQLPFKDRMTEVAKKWKALSESERSAWLARNGSATGKPAVSESLSGSESSTAAAQETPISGASEVTTAEDTEDRAVPTGGTPPDTATSPPAAQTSATSTATTTTATPSSTPEEVAPAAPAVEMVPASASAQSATAQQQTVAPPPPITTSVPPPSATKPQAKATATERPSVKPAKTSVSLAAMSPSSVEAAVAAPTEAAVLPAVSPQPSTPNSAFPSAGTATPSAFDFGAVRSTTGPTTTAASPAEVRSTAGATSNPPPVGSEFSTKKKKKLIIKKKLIRKKKGVGSLHPSPSSATRPATSSTAFPPA